MQVEKCAYPEIMKSPFEHESIRQRLAGKFSYFSVERAKWFTIINLYNPDCTSDSIKIRCKWARNSITLPYPFELTEGVIYLWGLVAGSAYKKKQLEICVDANQGKIIKAIVKELGLQIKISKVKRPRKKFNSIRIPRYYKKIRVEIPSIFLKFLGTLGYQPNKPSIPPWITDQQKVTWLEGYLNSTKLQCRIRKGRNIAPRVEIFISQNEIKLLQGISEILDTLDIEYSIYRIQERLRLEIFKISSIIDMVLNFNINRPKFRALSAILEKSEENPALRMCLQKLPLSDFQLTLFGIALDKGKGESEYTIFEDTFATSSNDIRTNLYKLHQWGLINYYKNENNREFLTLDTRYIHLITQLLEREEKQLKAHLKFSDSSALSFYCGDCDEVHSYIEVIGDHSFECPKCGRRDLEPLEISRYVYYGKLGFLTVQQKILQGAPL